MTARQRLLDTIAGKIPDRVPISTYELCGFNSHSFENKEPSYESLMAFIREHTDAMTMWNPQDNCTCFHTAAPVPIKTEIHREGTATVSHFTLETPMGPLTKTNRDIDQIHTTWQVEHWCKDLADVDKILSIPFVPVTYSNSDLSRVSAETGDHGILLTSIGDPLCSAMELMEFGEATIWALTETAHFKKTLDALFVQIMENLKNMLQANVVDLYRICGPEYATPPYLPPNLFHEFVTPYVSKMTALIHSYGGKVRLHSHGKIAKVLDAIQETGVDGLDPCESAPDGDISLAELKQRTENKLCLFGNIQLKLLERGTPEQVRKEVISLMEQAKSGGHFVIMPTASPINVPLSMQTQENYKVLIQTALEYGKY